MDAGIITAVVSAVLGPCLVGWLSYTTARMRKLEATVDTIRGRHRLLWKYCQDLIVHINTGKGAPAPDWPAGLTDMDPE